MKLTVVFLSWLLIVVAYLTAPEPVEVSKVWAGWPSAAPASAAEVVQSAPLAELKEHAVQTNESWESAEVEVQSESD